MLTTIAEANAFFVTRLNVGTFWDDDVADATKTAALTTAEVQLGTAYTLGDPATDVVKQGIYEQAFFLLQQGEGVDRRAGLQAMNVSTAGTVREAYRQMRAGQIAIAPMAAALLADLETAAGVGAFLGLGEVERDESEDTE